MAEHFTVKENLAKPINAMKGFAQKIGLKKEDTAEPKPLSKEDQLKRQAKETAEGFKKDAHDATLEKIQQAANQFFCQGKEDTDSLIAEVLAKSHNIETTAKFCSAYDLSDRLKSDGVQFYRTTFANVYVSSLQGDEGVLSMQTKTVLQTKVFPALPKLPSILTDLVPLPMTNGNAALCPHYKSYIEKVLLLQEDFVKPVLCILRVHLNDLHLAIGTIEAWLREPKADTDFLNQLFGSDLKTPRTNQYEGFQEESFNLLTAPSPGDMKLSLKVSTDKFKLRHFVAFAKPAPPVGASNTGSTRVTAVNNNMKEVVVTEQDEAGIARNKGCLSFFTDDSGEAAEF